jgi:hypothetical protein
VDIPAALTPEDELPHEPSDAPLWCENYLPQAYCPNAGIGVYFHLCHSPQEGLWEQEFVIYLPDDRFLVASAVSQGVVDNGIYTSNISFHCDEPFQQWTKRYIGGARLVTGDELRAGPLTDGAHVRVEFEMQTTALGPPFEFEGMPDQIWATRHYEQHHEVAGTLKYGRERIDFSGTGLREHSWGPRDYKLFGNTVWLHGQFPESGRTFVVVHVPGVGSARPFNYALIGDRTKMERATLSNKLPLVSNVEEAERGGYILELESPSGTAKISGEIISAMRMAFRGANGISMGFHRGPDVNHVYVEAQTRYEWDGEIGYGLSERSMDISQERLESHR